MFCGISHGDKQNDNARLHYKSLQNVLVPAEHFSRVSARTETLVPAEANPPEQSFSVSHPF